MKRTIILYWVFTGLLALLMTFSGIGGLIGGLKAAEGMKYLGITPSLVTFLSVAKLAGVIALLVPGFPRLKEWAYAGFIFDVTGAVYLTIAAGDPASAWMPIFIAHILIACSYIFYHKKLKPAPLSAR